MALEVIATCFTSSQSFCSSFASSSSFSFCPSSSCASCQGPRTRLPWPRCSRSCPSRWGRQLPPRPLGRAAASWHLSKTWQLLAQSWQARSWQELVAALAASGWTGRTRSSSRGLWGWSGGRRQCARWFGPTSFKLKCVNKRKLQHCSVSSTIDYVHSPPSTSKYKGSWKSI